MKWFMKGIWEGREETLINTYIIRTDQAFKEQRVGRHTHLCTMQQNKTRKPKPIMATKINARIRTTMGNERGLETRHELVVSPVWHDLFLGSVQDCVAHG